ncbi:enolase C-terminal domain-like protein, partial [Pseudomonas syringae group genomosp. 7]|uniref:enolase C-terminal domain-like protein n=1 Tax=Pseudomonas syringae group genomosp. 7 TaxID=251699 RepID=UPI0037701D19
RLLARWDFKRVMSEGLGDIIQPVAAPAGGISEPRNIRQLAVAYDVAQALHSPLGPIALQDVRHIHEVGCHALIQGRRLGSQ